MAYQHIFCLPSRFPSHTWFPSRFCVPYPLPATQHITPVERQGWVFGASVGYGSTSLTFPAKQQTDGDVALDAKVGYMVKPHLVLLLTTNVSIYDYSGFGRNRKRDFGVVAPAVQYWVSDRLWVLGGAGLGGDNPVFWDLKNLDAAPLETKYYPGLGFVAAIGYEIYQRNRLAIDLKTKRAYRNVAMPEAQMNGFTLAVSHPPAGGTGPESESAGLSLRVLPCL